MARFHATTPASESYYDSESDDEEVEFIPCACTQQLSAVLFGIIFGYIAILLFRSTTTIAIFIATGNSLGSLGAEKPTPCKIKLYEYMFLTVTVSLPAQLLLYVWGTKNHIIVLFIAVFLSAVAHVLKGMYRLYVAANEREEQQRIQYLQIQQQAQQDQDDRWQRRSTQSPAMV